ncbi:FAM65A-like isoform X1 [Brachionus plicatilis]|uniref:FAM65A-like isoform X1 n=1 Tax=Brachionus plicatilis TaxID=10195 RepID=A0A3M7RTN1_BRAPC|nr:FAM65A-like isoform X1 [Brachionus plicatilis]
MFASNSYSSALNTAETAYSSSSSSAYSSPPGSPFISLPIAQPIIGQKRSQRKQKNSVSVSFSSNNMSSILSAHSYEQVTSTLPKNASFYQASSPISPDTSQLINTKKIVPKSPRPQRTILILDSVLSGLNLCIEDLKNKVNELTIAVTNGYNAMAKQLLQSESYLRHLETRITNLLKLKNSYVIHLKMREGIQNIYEAYKKTPSKNQVKNLANIKSGWKECIRTLCLIEAQTEALLGTFRFQIEKLIGFARLCPGDVYQIQIKYGSNSKFRTRTKIAKDCSQQWDTTNFTFKISIHDHLQIKINEIKFFGKNVTIGERFFDIKDLFSTTQTQRLTLNANTSGSIKLSMLITWMPFESSEDNFTFFNPSQLLTKNRTVPKSSSFQKSSELAPQTRPSSLYLSDINENKELNFSTLSHEDPEPKLNTLISSTSTSSSSLEKSSQPIDPKADNRNSIKSVSSNETTNSFDYSKSESALSAESEDIEPQVQSVLNELIEKIESPNLVNLKYKILKNNLHDLRSIYIELNDLFNCLIKFDALCGNRNDNADPIDGLDLNLNLNENQSVNFELVLQEYFDFLNLESDVESVKLFSTGAEPNEAEAGPLVVNILDYDCLLINHFERINQLLNNLNFVSKNEFSNYVINENQAKFEQVILDSLSCEEEILNKIYKFFHMTKNIQPSLNNLINLMNNADYGDLWLESLEAERFFCARSCLLKDKILHHFDHNSILFTQLVDFVLESFSHKSFVSIFYFDTVFDLLKKISHLAHANIWDSNFFENFFSQFENEKDKILILRNFFPHTVDHLIVNETDFKNFIDKNKQKKLFVDLSADYVLQSAISEQHNGKSRLVEYLIQIIK